MTLLKGIKVHFSLFVFLPLFLPPFVLTFKEPSWLASGYKDMGTSNTFNLSSALILNYLAFITTGCLTELALPQNFVVAWSHSNSGGSSSSLDQCPQLNSLTVGQKLWFLFKWNLTPTFPKSPGWCCRSWSSCSILYASWVLIWFGTQGPRVCESSSVWMAWWQQKEERKGNLWRGSRWMVWSLRLF